MKKIICKDNHFHESFMFNALPSESIKISQFHVVSEIDHVSILKVTIKIKIEITNIQKKFMRKKQRMITAKELVNEGRKRIQAIQKEESYSCYTVNSIISTK